MIFDALPQSTSIYPAKQNRINDQDKYEMNLMGSCLDERGHNNLDATRGESCSHV